MILRDAHQAQLTTTTVCAGDAIYPAGCGRLSRDMKFSALRRIDAIL
jgi:hypothetical protein